MHRPFAVLNQLGLLQDIRGVIRQRYLYMHMRALATSLFEMMEQRPPIWHLSGEIHDPYDSYIPALYLIDNMSIYSAHKMLEAMIRCAITSDSTIHVQLDICVNELELILDLRDNFSHTHYFQYADDKMVRIYMGVRVPDERRYYPWFVRKN